MTDTHGQASPFRDRAKNLSARMDYITMSFKCDRVRSHAWWKNLVDHGAWKGPGGTRVGPPDREALPGIAKLFRTTPEQVAIMVAADWYGVSTKTDIPEAVKALLPALEELPGDDLELIRDIAERLQKS